MFFIFVKILCKGTQNLIKFARYYIKDMLTYLYLIAGLALLILGGDYLVKGGVAVAKRFKVPSLIIGMTIVALGTSSPEFIVSLQSALQGHPEISLGNVVGSNMVNIGVILGVTALILPMAVNRTSVKIDVPFMIFCTLLFYVIAQDNFIGRCEGLLFVVLIILFIALSIYKGKKDEKKDDKECNAKECKNKRYIRREFSYTKLHQTLALPENADKNGIEATVKHGVLQIIIPKLSSAQIEAENKVIDVK
jgi:Ca2+/Na+ antiporter